MRDKKRTAKDDTDARLDRAIEAAEAEFWLAVAQAYPEIKTGDLDPGATLTFRSAMREAVAAWLDENAPKPPATAACELAVEMRPPQRGEMGFHTSTATAESALVEVMLGLANGEIWTADKDWPKDEHAPITVIFRQTRPTAVAWEYPPCVYHAEEREQEPPIRNMVGRVVGERVEVTRDCDIGREGECATVTEIDGRYMTLLFRDRGATRTIRTGCDYLYLRHVKLGPYVRCPDCHCDDLDALDVMETFTGYHRICGTDPDGNTMMENALTVSTPHECFDEGSEDYTVFCNKCGKKCTPREAGMTDPATWQWV